MEDTLRAERLDVLTKELAIPIRTIRQRLWEAQAVRHKAKRDYRIGARHLKLKNP
jgi:hypothetical protein